MKIKVIQITCVAAVVNVTAIAHRLIAELIPRKLALRYLNGKQVITSIFCFSGAAGGLEINLFLALYPRRISAYLLTVPFAIVFSHEPERIAMPVHP